MKKILTDIRNELKTEADDNTRESGKRFFKEEIKLYGVKTGIVTKLSKDYYKKLHGIGKDELFALCEELWKSGYMEESFIACNWSYYVKKDYKPGDIELFEKWIGLYVSNWASCDTLCNHTVGALIDLYPDRISYLKKWCGSDNSWMRRASAVSLIIPARDGRFPEDIFEIADLLITDSDDLVQKGYGWMLKAASQANNAEVFEYVMRNKKIMPRTALRYAIEKMPAELKVRAMARE